MDKFVSSGGASFHLLSRHPGLSASLAPPPLDNDLPVSERLSQVKTCLGRPSAGRKSVVVTYDIIHVYKTLVLSCGISLEGNYEDPKVASVPFFFNTLQLSHLD